MYYDNTLHPDTLRQWLSGYTQLSRMIKNNQSTPFNLYGTELKPTELDRYVDLVYTQTSEDYLLDQFGRSLF